LEGSTVGFTNDVVLCHGHVRGQRLFVALNHLAEVILELGLFLLQLLRIRT